MNHATCTIPACDKPPRSGTAAWCAMHYHRWYRHGDPMVTLTPGGSRSVNARGYVVVTGYHHPLARKGQVLLHRATLYDAIGPGEHPCHWCARPVDWAVNDLRDPRCLTVDHIDHDRLNNAVNNLVPSCNPCNVRRQPNGEHLRAWLERADRRAVAEVNRRNSGEWWAQATPEQRAERGRRVSEGIRRANSARGATVRS